MKNIKIISQKLKTLNKKLYIVWGFCRSKILWINNIWEDIDLVTDAVPNEMKKVLKIVWEVWKKYWTLIVNEWWESFEITTFRKDIWTVNNRKPAKVIFTNSLEEDSRRRDFTCNAIYYDIENKKYIDPTWWIEDIKNNIIKFVWNTEDRLEEDIIRLLRYVRFKHKLELLDYNSENTNIFKNKFFLLKNIPIERVRQEFDKILIWKNNVKALQELKDIWFLKLFFPEVDILETVPWNKWHLEWNVWIHIKMCIKELNKYLKKSKKVFSKQDKIILYYSIFLHDIAKYNTLTFDEKWESHYYNHENIWASIFKEEIANRLKFTNIQKKEIYWIIKNHIRLFLILKMKKLKSRRLMINSLFDKLLIIWEVDNAWRIPVKTNEIKEIKKMYKNFKELLKTKKFLTWKDIIKKYPDLKWRQIWERLKMYNDQILAKD